MDKFSRLFYKYTDGKYDYLRIKNVDVNTEARAANVYVYLREDKYDDFDNALIKELRAFFSEIVPKYTFYFHFERLLVSADLAHRRLTEYVMVNYPFIAANIVFDTVDVVVTHDCIECTVYLPDYIMQYAKERDFAKRVEEDLGDDFIMPVKVNLELTDVVVEESQVDKTKHAYSVVPVDGIKYLCGVKSEYSRMPTMLSMVNQPMERVAVCGDMSDMRLKTYEPEEPKEGEESKRRFYKYHYTFNLADGTDNIRVLFNTNDDKCPLKDVTDGQFMVRGRVFYNERTQSYNVFAKTVYRCVIDKAKLEDMLKPLPVPDTYSIQPVEVHEVEKPVQLAIGLEDEPGGPKRLAGNHVFLYMRSAAKDKLVPYELCAFKTEGGKPTLAYTTYVYCADLLSIDVAIKSSVSTAPRISDVVPDLVKFFDGCTVVCFRLEKVQHYLVDIAKALRYVFTCDWSDADSLLKKGKETFTFAKMCRTKQITIDGEDAAANARALYELFLSEKGIG